jgi:hypothetical protein
MWRICAPVCGAVIFALAMLPKPGVKPGAVQFLAHYDQMPQLRVGA